jgi:hypothetical protein
MTTDIVAVERRLLDRPAFALLRERGIEGAQGAVAVLPGDRTIGGER